MCLGRRTWKELGKEVESTGPERRMGQGVWKESWKEALKEGGSGGRGERIVTVGTEESRFYSGWNWKSLADLRQGVTWLWLIFALIISLWLLGALVLGGCGWGKAEMEARRQSNEGIYPSWTGNATFTFVISFKYDEIVLFNALHSTKVYWAKAMIWEKVAQLLKNNNSRK